LPRGWRCIGETGTTSNDIARRRISNRAALAEGLSPRGSRRSATYPAPVFGQQSEDLRIGRLAVDEEALAQQAFAAEAERLQQSTRGRVARMDVRFDAVQAEAAEPPVQRQGDRLSRQSPAPLVGMQGVTDLRAAVPRVEAVQR